MVSCFGFRTRVTRVEGGGWNVGGLRVEGGGWTGLEHHGEIGVHRDGAQARDVPRRRL